MSIILKFKSLFQDQSRSRRLALLQYKNHILHRYLIFRLFIENSSAEDRNGCWWGHTEESTLTVCLSPSGKTPAGCGIPGIRSCKHTLATWLRLLNLLQEQNSANAACISLLPCFWQCSSQCSSRGCALTELLDLSCNRVQHTGMCHCLPQPRRRHSHWEQQRQRRPFITPVAWTAQLSTHLGLHIHQSSSDAIETNSSRACAVYQLLEALFSII